jgi:hypothetical protein
MAKAKQRQSHGPPMTLGNMRQQRVLTSLRTA